MKLEDCKIGKLVLVKSKSICNPNRVSEKIFTYESFLEMSPLGIGEITHVGPPPFTTKEKIVVEIAPATYSVSYNKYRKFCFLPKDLIELKKVDIKT